MGLGSRRRRSAVGDTERQSAGGIGLWHRRPAFGEYEQPPMAKMAASNAANTASLRVDQDSLLRDRWGYRRQPARGAGSSSGKAEVHQHHERFGSIRQFRQDRAVN